MVIRRLCQECFIVATSTGLVVGGWNKEIPAEGDTPKVEAHAKTPTVYLDTLKITNINAEGPNKTATGGMAADVLLKYGKKFTVEMQDAMGRYGVLENLYGAKAAKNKQILAITDRFPGEYTLVGSTFVIDQATGAKQPVKIVIPVFLGNGIFNLTQDAEGDVTVFDLNGDVLRFEKESLGSIKDKKYEPGADNSFYFFATEHAFEGIRQYGYREAMEAKTIEVDKNNVATLEKEEEQQQA